MGLFSYGELVKQVDKSFDCLLDCYNEWIQHCMIRRIYGHEARAMKLQNFLDVWKHDGGHVEYIYLMLLYHELGTECVSRPSATKYFIRNSISTTQRHLISSSFVTRPKFDVAIPQPSTDWTQDEQTRFTNENDGILYQSKNSSKHKCTK
jgi:hypothetical protein